MFISIPDEFYVRIQCENKGNLDLIDIPEAYFMKSKVESRVVFDEKVIKENVIFSKQGKIYEELDGEYIDEATRQEHIELDNFNSNNKLLKIKS